MVRPLKDDYTAGGGVFNCRDLLAGQKVWVYVKPYEFGTRGDDRLQDRAGWLAGWLAVAG